MREEGENIKNKEVAKLLENIADLLELKGESPYRVAAYREAGRRIGSLVEDVADYQRQGRLEEIPDVGPSIAAKIDEYLRTGHLKYYDELKKEVAPGPEHLMKVRGIGAKRAELIYKSLGVATIPQLIKATQDHKLHHLPGIGEKTEQKILREAERVTQSTQRMLLSVALSTAEEVVDLLKKDPAVMRIEPAGSIRRMKETIGDIDIVVASNRPLEVMETFTTLPIVEEVLLKGPTRSSILTHDGHQVDLRVVKPEDWGSALQYFTGNKDHSIAVRDLAIRKGLKLNEYGIFDEATGKRLGGRTEEEIYHILGMDWIPPELRLNRGEIQAALEHRLPKLVEESDILGDLHVHSNWSDGGDPIEVMVEAAIKRGYQYIALTDHSKSLRVAGGLSVDRVMEQHRLIEKLNQKYAPFRILHGAEVNILADGTLDYDDETLAVFDWVSVSIHSGFGQPQAKMTARIIKALCHPMVDLLNHPTGRLIGKRPGYAVDLEKVLQAAAETGKFVEINSQPDRLDLDDVWARRAKELGVVLSIDTDAHEKDHYSFLRYGVAVARRGWLEKKNVLNTLPLKQLMDRLHGKKKAA